MAITAFLYRSNGQAIMERQYTGPGQYYIDQATAIVTPMEVGNTRLIHMGHGQFHRFECVATDSKHMLLQAT